MQFMATWRIKPEHVSQSVERFKETGAMPPAGVKMIGRWHDVAGGHGFTLAETDDPVAISSWCMRWADLLDFEIAPVVTDEQLAKALSE